MDIALKLVMSHKYLTHLCLSELSTKLDKLDVLMTVLVEDLEPTNVVVREPDLSYTIRS